MDSLMKNATVKYLFLVLVCCLMTACLPGKKREEKVIADAAKATQSVMTEKVAADLSNAANALLGNSESTGESNSELATLRCADGRVLAYIPRTAKVAKQGELPAGVASRMREQLQSQYSPQNVKTADALAGCGGDPQLVAMNGPVLVLDSISAALAEVKKDEAVASFEIGECPPKMGEDGLLHKTPGVIIRYNDGRPEENKCGVASLGGDSKVELANNAMPDWRKRLSGDATATTNFKCVVKKGRTNGCTPVTDQDLGDKVDCNEAAERREIVLNPVFNDATNTFISGPGNRDCGKGWSGDLIAQVDTKVCTITRKDGTVEAEPSTVYDIAYVAARCSKDNVVNIPVQCPAGPGTFFARYGKVEMVDPIQLEPQTNTARAKKSGTKSLIATSATADLAPAVTQSILSKIGGGKVFKPTANLRAVTDPDQFSAALVADMGESAKLYQISGCNTVGNTCGSSPDHIVIVLDRSISMGSQDPADLIAVKPTLNKTYSCKAGLRNIFQADKASDSCQKVNAFLANQGANPAANDKKLLDFILTPWAGLSAPNSSNTEIYSALENSLVDKEKYKPYLQQALATGWNCSGQKQADETIKPFPTNMFGSCSGASSCDTCPGECVAENIGVSPGLETTRIKAAKLNLVNISKMKMKPGTNITVAEFLNDIPNIRTTTYCPAERRNSAGVCDEAQERKNVLNYLTGGEQKVYLKPVTQEITIPKEPPGASSTPTTPTPASDVRSTRTRIVYIIPDQRYQSGSFKESNSLFEAPANTVITGRYHSGDENGQTAYKYASLKAVYEDGTPAPGTVTLEDIAWSGWWKESNQNSSPFSDTRVMIGRQHNGDENGQTRHKLATIKYDGQVMSRESYMTYAAVAGKFKVGETINKESDTHWAEAGGWEFMYNRNHVGDEKGKTIYVYGSPQKEITLTSDACPAEEVTGMGEWKTAAQAQADGTFNASGTGAYADYEPRQNTSAYTFRNCSTCTDFNCPGQDGWMMSAYTQNNGGGMDTLDPGYSDPNNEGGPRGGGYQELPTNGETYIREYCAERRAKSETFKFGSTTCGGTSDPGPSCNVTSPTTLEAGWETFDYSKGHRYNDSSELQYNFDQCETLHCKQPVGNYPDNKPIPQPECAVYGDNWILEDKVNRTDSYSGYSIQDKTIRYCHKRQDKGTEGVDTAAEPATETCTTTQPAPVCTTQPGTCEAGGPGQWETYAQAKMAGTENDSNIPNHNMAGASEGNASNVADYEFRSCTRYQSCGYDEGVCAYEGNGSASCGGRDNCLANNPPFSPPGGWITDHTIASGSPQFGFNFDYNFCTERRKKVVAGNCTTTNIPAGQWETWQEAIAAGKNLGRGSFSGEAGAEYEYDQCREADCKYSENACYAGHESECAQAASCYSQLFGGVQVDSTNHDVLIPSEIPFSDGEHVTAPNTDKFCERRRTKARTVTGSPTPVTTCTTPAPVTTCTPVEPETPQACATNMCDPSACALLIDGEETTTPPPSGGSCEPSPLRCELEVVFQNEQSAGEWPSSIATQNCELDAEMQVNEQGGDLEFHGRTGNAASLKYWWGTAQGQFVSVRACQMGECSDSTRQSVYKYKFTGTVPPRDGCSTGGTSTTPGAWEHFADAAVSGNANYDQNTGEPAPGTVGMYDYDQCTYARADSFSRPMPFQDKENGVTNGYGDFCNLRRLKGAYTNTGGSNCQSYDVRSYVGVQEYGPAGGQTGGTNVFGFRISSSRVFDEDITVTYSATYPDRNNQQRSYSGQLTLPAGQQQGEDSGIVIYDASPADGPSGISIDTISKESFEVCDGNNGGGQPTTGGNCTTTQPADVCTTTPGGTSGGTPAGPWFTATEAKANGTYSQVNPTDYEYDSCVDINNCDAEQSYCDYSNTPETCGPYSALAQCQNRYNGDISQLPADRWSMGTSGGGCGWSACNTGTETYCSKARKKAVPGTSTPPTTTCTTPPPVTTCTGQKSYEKLLACLDKCSPKESAPIQLETCTSVVDLFKGTQAPVCKTAPFPSKLDYSYNGYTGEVAKTTVTRYVLGKAGDPGAIAVDQNTANAIYGADYGGNTPLFDVIQQALDSDKVKADMQAKKNMAFIVLTDGEDTGNNPVIKDLCDDSASMLSVVRAQNANTNTMVISYNDTNSILAKCRLKQPDKFVEDSKLELATSLVSSLASSGDYGTAEASSAFCATYFGTGEIYTNTNISSAGSGISGGNICRAFESE
jgi:hypothetical protein